MDSTRALHVGSGMSNEAAGDFLLDQQYRLQSYTRGVQCIEGVVPLTISSLLYMISLTSIGLLASNSSAFVDNERTKSPKVSTSKKGERSLRVERFEV